jgi:Xaa-Pro aminopeptidase
VTQPTLEGRGTLEETALFEPGEFFRRVERFQRLLAARGMGGALLAQVTDRYYFSGTSQMGWLFVPASGDPLLLVRKDVERARRESPLLVEPLDSMRDLRRAVEAKYGVVPQPLGLEMDVLPVLQKDRFAGLFSGVTFADASQAVMLTRAVKSEAEVEAVRRAARIVGQAVARVPEWLRPGVAEIELAAEVEHAMRLAGHGGFMPMRGFNQRLFYGHIFAGATAAEPSGFDAPTGGMGLSPAVAQGSSRRAVETGEPVVVDLVGHWGGYLCDQTRMFSVGRPNEPFEAVFEAALDLQRAVAEAARPGVKASRLYEIALEKAAKTPFADHFLGDGDKVSFVGHGIGLEVDEYPFLARGFDMPLEEGMVFALEPKFIFRGLGVAGIEDTYVVRGDGVERLTVSPQEWCVV